MTNTANSGQSRPASAIQLRWLVIAALLVAVGLVGTLHAAIGYGLLLTASLLLVMGIGFLSIFLLTNWFDTALLQRSYAGAFWLGGWGYLLAVAAMSGYYINDAIAGKIAWKYIVFGPAAIMAIAVFDIGIWRIIVKRNMPSVRRFGVFWKRETIDQRALRRTLVDEVVLHKTLFTISPFRWVRHQLIFWGFGAMFLTEILAVGFREVIPAFGMASAWEQPNHPIRLAFDFAFELTGVMMLVGCLLALAFRLRAQGGGLQKYTDTPSVVFLLAVVVSGFLIEGVRMSSATDVSGASLSFIGLAVSRILPISAAWYDPLWMFHALFACLFIAYIPFKKMIHSCAVPIGRMLNSQTNLLSAKKTRSISGLFRQGDQD